jgi:peroxiredoxin
MRSLVLVITAAALITSGAAPAAVGQSAPATTRIDVSKLGPQVGERVPDFSLKDQAGRTQTLQSIMGRRGAVLVFVRSTEWCPYCKTQLVELQGRAASLQSQGLGIAVISYDSQEVHARFSQQRGITFPLLADVGSETIKRFGLLNPVPAMALGPDKDDPDVKALVQKYVSVVNPTARMVGIAFPGTFILDRQGRVTSRFFEDFYIERTTMANLMVRAGAGNEEIAATKVSTGHLEVTTYTTDRDVAPGNRFSIVLEITPKPGIHVYAPGAKDYRVVTLDIPSQPFLRADPTRFPASEIYHFKPLDERVPVYQKPFRLVREVVLDGQPQAQAAYRGRDSLTISGTLEYQACDDKICFNPVTLPLSWTVGLRSLVRDPAPTQTR